MLFAVKTNSGECMLYKEMEVPPVKGQYPPPLGNEHNKY